MYSCEHSFRRHQVALSSSLYELLRSGLSTTEHCSNLLAGWLSMLQLLVSEAMILARAAIATWFLSLTLNWSCVCRCTDWNVETGTGLCSWPTTPMHDPTAHQGPRLTAIRQAKQVEGRSNKSRCFKEPQSVHSSTDSIGDVMRWQHGECLVLSSAL